jgi:hypothetical protein
MTFLRVEVLKCLGVEVLKFRSMLMWRWVSDARYSTRYDPPPCHRSPGRRGFVTNGSFYWPVQKGITAEVQDELWLDLMKLSFVHQMLIPKRSLSVTGLRDAEVSCDGIVLLAHAKRYYR